MGMIVIFNMKFYETNSIRIHIKLLIKGRCEGGKYYRLSVALNEYPASKSKIDRQ